MSRAPANIKWGVGFDFNLFRQVVQAGTCHSKVGFDLNLFRQVVQAVTCHSKVGFDLNLV